MVTYLIFKKPAFCRLLFFIVFSMQAHGKVTYFNEQLETYDLGDVNFTTYLYDFKVNFSDGAINYGTSLYSGFETSFSDLFDYSIVQFVKGCAYSNVGNETFHNRLHYNFEETKVLKYQSYVIDSGDFDPSLGSTFSGRHDLYRWERDRNFRGQWSYVYEASPKDSFLFTYSTPGTVSKTAREVQNMSLRYETCLFYTDDVPKRTSSNDLSFKSNALYCKSWMSSWVYDTKEGKYKNPKHIRSECLE